MFAGLFVCSSCLSAAIAVEILRVFLSDALSMTIVFSGLKRPLDHGVGARGHFELGAAACCCGLGERLRDYLLRRLEAVYGFQVVAG